MATIVTSIFHSSAEWEQDEQHWAGTPEQAARIIEQAFRNGKIVKLIDGAERIELVSKETEGRLTRFVGKVDGTNKMTITVL